MRPIAHPLVLFTAAASLALAAPAAQASADDLIYTTTGNGSEIATIDPSTASATVVGPTGHVDSYAAVIDTDGTLWTTVQGYALDAQIATVDKTTGAATPRPGKIGAAMHSLEIAADGTMYGIGYNDQKLYRIDKTTGVGTPIGTGTGIYNAMDLAFDCEGKLWATVSDGMWVVDTDTGAATAKPSITGVPSGSVMGLMVDSSCRMLATSYTTPGLLYTIDTDTGAATPIGDTGLSYPHGGDIGAFESDGDAPTTADDVPAGFVNTAPTVTLTASDGTGSGVARIYCEIGVDPPAPTTASPVYDPGEKPTLAHGERIRYFAVDKRGNAEQERSSAPAKVDTLPPATTDDVPAASRESLVPVTLSATDLPTTHGGFAGVQAIYYEIGTDPPAPTTASRRYDPTNRPVLTAGERISYFAVDAAGNAEAPKSSRPLSVEEAEPPARISQRQVTINLRSRYRGRPVRAVRATVDGRRVKATKTRRGYRVHVDLRGHDCTPAKVQIRISLKRARSLTVTRVFKTCTPGRSL